MFVHMMIFLCICLLAHGEAQIIFILKMHKCTTTLEILVYGTNVDVIDEYCQFGKNIAIEYEQSSSNETF
jgi:hypothetical protein